MSLIESVKAYIAQYAELDPGAPLWVDYIGSEPTSYTIIPLPGTKIVQSYINGGSMREFPFSFRSMELTADEAERLDNIGFFEAFAEWLEAQSEGGVLPTLEAGKTPLEIEAVSWAYIKETSESDTATYNIQCKLTYEQAPVS
jgi:hypothetical protein